jgi:hypothetical protein
MKTATNGILDAADFGLSCFFISPENEYINPVVLNWRPAGGGIAANNRR